MRFMENENVFLLHALLMGIFITFVYDLLRIFRLVVPHNGFFVSAEDLLFWVYCGGEVFLLMYHESDGTLRWFAVLGALAGMYLYMRLVSPLFVKYISLGLRWFISLFQKILHFFFRPVRFMFRKTGNAARKTGRGMFRLLGRLKKRIKNKLTYFMKTLKMTIKA